MNDAGLVGLMGHILPFGYSPGLAFLLALGLVGAAWVRGYSGFGFSAVFIAFASLWTNPLPLIPVVFACEITMTLFQARGIAGFIDWRRVGVMLAGAAVAMPLAVSVLAALGEDTVRSAVAALIMALALFLASGWQAKRPLGTGGRVMVGVVSGVANAGGVGGLPVAAALSAEGMPAIVFRATLIAYMTGLDLLTLPVMGAHGLVGWDTARAAVLAFPILGLGIWLGTRRFGHASEDGFRKVVVALLMGLALIGLARGLLA